MSVKRSGGGPDDPRAASWASESLPLSVRKELLERELQRLGFRKAEARRAAAGVEGGLQQESQSAHPQADSPGQHPG